MDFKREFIPYNQTGYFSKIVTDYLSHNNLLEGFYQHQPDLPGVKDAISLRKDFNTNRQLLLEQLQNQYLNIQTSDLVKNNIIALQSENTFTVCTAHQPNIFTGHLYFIYKIIHVIKIAETLNKELPENKFVPVFYMGSEDADIKELGEIFINGENYNWDTKQTGAVGRMLVDDELLLIIKKIKGQIVIESFGKEIIELIETCYVKGRTIQDACFYLVNELFSNYGLIVLQPDNAAFKKQMSTVFQEDIFSHIPYEIVNATTEKLSKNYSIQAQPREINLFYLKDNIRERIVLQNSKFKILNTKLEFTEDELKTELINYPERFSPNVILRALYQETILPNILFVGGGGELAYWLELRDMFQHYKVPYPVLVLRNSFLLVNGKTGALIRKLSLYKSDIFKSEEEQIKSLVNNKSIHQLSLQKQKQQIELIYNEINSAAKEIDTTLIKHVEALHSQHLNKLEKLERKFLKAEKKRFESEKNQIHKISSNLFPGNNLQERVENFIPFYAKWGKEFINILYDNSLVFEQEFCVIKASE